MPRSQHTYDHRLVRLVQDTGDIAIATGAGVPRSTASGWLRQARRDVTTVPTRERSPADVRIREMVTSPNWRHVPAGRLALLAQRLGRVFACAST